MFIPDLIYYIIINGYEYKARSENSVFNLKIGFISVARHRVSTKLTRVNNTFLLSFKRAKEIFPNKSNQKQKH